MLTLFGGAPLQPLDDTGHVVPLGQLWFYQTGTDTLQDTYTDAEGMAIASNPVVLDAAGRASIYLAVTPAYDVLFEFRPLDVSPHGVQIWFQPGVIANAAAS